MTGVVREDKGAKARWEEDSQRSELATACTNRMQIRNYEP